MNSQNPNPNEGQQPGTPSEGSTGQDPEHPVGPDNTEPATHTEPENTGPAKPTEPANTAPTNHTEPENPTEPLFPPPAHRAPAYSAPGYGRPAQPLNFFGWIRSHGVHRGRDRWIGGVSGGIAERMGIDPLIVRGIFIVLTLFAGIGVLLYGLGWALLPEPDGRIHTQEAGTGRWSTGMTGALITSIVGLTGMGGGFWGWGHDGFGFFWALFWIGGVIYLIYFLTQRNKNRTGATVNGTTGGGTPYGYATPGNAPANAAAGSATSPFTASSFAAGSHGPTQPYTVPPTPDAIPSYGVNEPYGSATPTGPYSGGLPPRRPAPVPSPVPAPKPRPSGPGAPAVAITAGLALLAGGTLKALDAGNLIDLGESANAVVWAAGAAVLGLGILLAGMRGRTSGVLGFFAVVALIVGGIFSAVPNGDRFRFQNADWNPVTIEQARQGFQITGGRGTVDLTGLNLNPPLGTDVVIPLDATASNVTVIIPRSVPVDVRADMTLGNLNEGTDSRSGITSRQSSYNSDKPGAKLILQIDGTVSNIAIQEGN
ncbi:PspC domain-containing protein [Arthrobacter globiformis]|uniref:PspC domain-containing protein n=1 Tax=Arthrobacter globiformis TaxID=1665 RepID=UPI002788F7E9|nr:PspC domain-containing protein [Arthrobacter globiformis]MDQ0866292.1 phage shock protein PspC (stress-responsive transcriptional regulator) [Arthrobacter globiformis]